MPYGQLKVYQDPSMFGNWKISYQAHLAHMVYADALHHMKYPQDVLAHIAKDMAKAIEKDIFEQLLTSSLAPESLQGISNYAQAQKQKHDAMLAQHQGSPWNDPAASWNNPNTDVLADIHKAAAILQSGKPYPAFDPPQAHGVLSTLVDAIPALKTAKAKCPANKRCGEEVYPGTTLVTTVVQHLNDQHKWTREQIADWLDTLDFDLSFQEPKMKGHSSVIAIQDEVNDLHALDAMKYALMTTPLLKPEDAVKIINPT